MTASSRFDAILFDKDGTLFDFHATWAGWLAAVLETLSRGDRERAARAGTLLGFDVPSRRFESDSLVIAGTPETIIAHLSGVFRDWDREGIARVVRDTGAAVKPVPAAPLRPLLSGLRGKVGHIGVVTNDWEEGAIDQLTQAGVLDLLDGVLGSDSGFAAKPDPAMLLALCERMRAEPGRCLMVGDTPTDMIAGRAAGMTALGVLTGVDSRESLGPHADAILADIGRIPDWLTDSQGGQS